MSHKHIVIDARIRQSSTGRYVDRLIEHLQKIDHENKYTVLVTPKDSWEPSAKNFSRLVSPYPQFSFNPLHQFGFAWQLYGLRPNLVHFPMNQQPLLYFGPVITSTMDMTMLRFTRAGKHSRIYHAIRMLAYRFLFWYSLKKSKRVITISEFVKQDVEEHYPFTKNLITVTYCASEPVLAGKAKPLKGVGKPFIMHVGSPFPHKNLERLVDAFELIKTEQPDLQLVLAGKKEYFFDQLIEKKISKSKHKNDVIVTGFIEDAELKWLYENASAYVLPSLSEGFGLPGLEAMAHGTPLASSNATCLPEVYGDAAAYFDPLDIQSIAVVVNEILTDSKLSNKLRTLGYKQVIRFSWKKMAKQTLEVYDQVLDKSDIRGNF